MRIALSVEYDGSHFCGWQAQDGGVRTVQECVEKALSKVANHPIKVICAGRTDAGVHATTQVIHFDTEVVRENKAWVMGVNTHLPADVSICWAQIVEDTFHARFKAVRRHYRYILFNHRSRPALLRHQVSWVHSEIDVSRMQQASQFFLGEHDFTSFRASSCQAHSPVRTIHHLEVNQQGRYVIIDICANAFLHHMVRNIVGVLLNIAKCGHEPEWVKELLLIRDRKQSGMTAPAEGLYLTGVEYPDEFALPESLRLPMIAQLNDI